MNKKTTHFLLVLALLTFAYIWIFEWRGGGGKAVAAAKLFPELESIAVKQLDISRTNQIIRAERTTDSWRLTLPAYPAQTTGIESLIKAIAALEPKGHLSAQELVGEPSGLKAFGLDPPQADITVHQENRRFRFLVGKETPLASQLYVQVIGAGGLYLVDSSFAHHIPTSAKDWRDPMLVEIPRYSMDRLQIREGPRVLELHRSVTNGGWRIEKPIPARADTNQVRHLLGQLQVARVMDFVADGVNVDLDKYGLETPDVSLAFLQGTNQLAKIEFGNSPTNNPALVYARRSMHTNIVLVSQELLNLLRLPHKKYHDPQLANVEISQVDQVTVSGRESFNVRLNEQGRWQFSAPHQFEADPPLIREMLTNLTALEIVDFAKDLPTATDLAQFRLEPPILRYHLARHITNAAGLPTNSTLLQLDFGTNQVDTIVARRADETPVYVTRLGDVVLLPKRAWQLRDRQIFNFNSTNLLKVRGMMSGATNALARTANGMWVADEVHNAAIEETLHRASQLRALSWVDRGTARLRASYGLAEPSLILEWDKRDEPVFTRIIFGRRNGAGNVYAAMDLPNDSEPVVFEVSGALFQDLLRDIAPPAGN